MEENTKAAMDWHRVLVGRGSLTIGFDLLQIAGVVVVLRSHRFKGGVR